MRKISRAEEQFTSLNFRTANSNRDWVEKNHADVMKNGFDCDVCGKKFPPGTDFDDIEENGGANKEAGRSCSPECTEELAERERDAEDGAATANAEWNYSRTAGFADPINNVTTRGFDASEGTDRGGHVDIVLPTHTCDIGNHEVKGDVTCAERYCMSRKRGEGTWDQHGHQNWSHNYACAEHMPAFGPRKGGPGPSLDHPGHVWQPEDNVGPTGPATGHDGLLLNPEECTNPVHREGFNNSDEYCNECGDNHIIHANKTASDKPWDEKDPDGGKHHKLSPEQKAKAKARAKAHGRPYPNWVDNAWASKN